MERLPNRGWTGGLSRTPLLVAICGFLLLPGFNLSAYWLTNPLYGYGLWVPLLAAVLAWRQSRAFPTENPQPPFPVTTALCTWPPLLFVVGFPAMRIIQVANPDWRLFDWALAVGAVVSSLCLIVREKGSRAVLPFVFPFAFLFTAIPWPTQMENQFTGWAVPIVAKAVSQLLWLFGTPTVESGQALLTPVGAVGIADDCGGIRSFQLGVMISLFWGAFFALPLGRRLLLVGVTMLLAVGTNVLRVAGLVYAGCATGSHDTIHRFHDLAGSLAQLALILAVPGVGYFLRAECAKPDRAEFRVRPPRAQFRPVTWRQVTVGAAIVILSFVGAELWYRSHEGWKLPPPALVVNANPPIAGVKRDAIPDNVNRNYRYSDAVHLSWNDAKGNAWTFVWLGFDPGNLSACIHNVHRPEVCLPNAQYTPVRYYPPLAIAVGGRPFIFEHQLYRQGKEFTHLFFADMYTSRPGAELERLDWSYESRIGAALKGLRSNRVDIVHLVVTGALDDEASARAATKYLSELLKPGTE